jgi:hypothetical protein
MDTLRALVGTIEETNNNDGAIIFRLQDCIGIPRKQPYCQATQYYSFYVSAKNLKMDTKNLPIPRNGLAQSSYNYAKQKGVKAPYNAEFGDLIVWKKDNTTKGHIGRIVEVGKMGWVVTIEGNTTNDTTKKEGIFYKKRNIKNPLNRILQVKGIVGFKIAN